MDRINLSGGAYQSRSVAASAQRVLNLYPEPLPQANGEPIQYAYYLTPGLRQMAQSSGAGRALYQTSQGDLVAVVGTAVLKIGADGSVSQIGWIGAGVGPIRIADNGTTMFLVDGSASGGWYCTMPKKAGSGGFGDIRQIRDSAFYGSRTIALLDTFFLFTNPETTNWYTSPSQFSDEITTPFDSLYVASDATSLSTVMAIEVVGQCIWIFGKQQTELWYDSGAADFPFQRMQGVTVEAGCLAPYSVARIPTTPITQNGGIMWLGQDRSGYARVYLGQQSAAVPVSTFAIEQILQSYGDLSGAVASAYQQAGHVFYVLTIPGQSSSWVYDVTTGLWHERCALDAHGNEVQIRPIFWAQAYGMIWAVDHDNGWIYKVDQSALDDAGTPIKRQRSFPHLLTNGNRGVHRRFMLDMQQASGAAISVDWSDDRGATFGAPRILKLGNSGNSWPSLWRLGMARDRVYRVTWTAAVQTALMGAFIDVEPVQS